MCFETTSSVIARPFLPNRPPQAPRRPEYLVSRYRGGAVGFPGASIATDRDDWFCSILKDRRMAVARVIGTVGGDGFDLFDRRDLPSSSGRMGLSPCQLDVNSTARISPVAVSIARFTLRHSRLRVAPCLRESHSPSPRKRMPVLSIRRFSGLPARRYGICTAIRA